MAAFKRTNRLATGGLVAVVAAVAVWLSGLFSGFGGGGGAGNGRVSVQTPDAGSATNVSNTKQLPDPPSDDEQTAEAIEGVVDVVIEEQSYFLRDGDQLQPAELSKVVQVARESRGNEDGIRVRIFYGKSSRPSAEETLINELVAAGIPKEAMWPRENF